MANVKYQYALINGDINNIISIDEITQDNRNEYKYFCIGCGREMLPRAISSKYKRPHFYHREPIACSGETYYHKLAKHIIKKRFDSSSSFPVKYNASRTCSNNDCKYRNPHCHEDNYQSIVDLKRYYDTCTEEAPIKGFIADLLLTNSKKPSIEPVLIEICVSHPCDDDKRNSGLRIIEIKVKKDEQDVACLKNEDIYELLHPSRTERHIEFISFKRKLVVPLKVKLQRYIFNPKHSPNGYLTKINCDDAQYRARPNSLLELNIINTENYAEAGLLSALAWMSQHKSLKRCDLCKFYYATMYEDKAKCRLSQKYGTPVYPSMDLAETCKNYYLKENNLSKFDDDTYFAEEVSSSMLPRKEEFRVIIITTRSFSDKKLYKEKVLHYLSEKANTHSIIILSWASLWRDDFLRTLEEDLDFINEPYEADWNKDAAAARKDSGEKMVESADALIAFWDGRSTGVKEMIERAKSRNLIVKIVPYEPSQRYSRKYMSDSDEGTLLLPLE